MWLYSVKIGLKCGIVAVRKKVSLNKGQPADKELLNEIMNAFNDECNMVKESLARMDTGPAKKR